MDNNLNQFNQGNLEQVPSGVVQHNLSNIMPTASEVGNLFAIYLAENMSVCMLQYMLAKSKDPEIKSILQESLNLSIRRFQSMKGLFNTINHPIPEGFGEQDVDINAPELFSETFSLAYTRIMNVYIGLKYSYSLGRSSRLDFRQVFKEGLITSTDLSQKATEVQLEKGLFMKPPNIVIPDRIDKVNNKKYYGSILGSKRPLSAIEIGHLYHNIEYKLLLSTLELGFSQVINSDKIKKQIYKGYQMHNEQAKILSSFLEKENLPTPITSEFQVTNSQKAPFSDKLILFHSITVAAFGLLDDGFALSSSSRKDIITAFSRLLVEIIEYSKDGTDLMIENGWLERVPQTANRKELIH